VSKASDLLTAALKDLPPKPGESAKASEKKAYSEQLSKSVAYAFGAELRRRGLVGALPAPPGDAGISGAERRMSGGIGAKKVDVTWATEESGLLLAISIKSINFADGRTNNYQKNLTNRRGDMLFESVTLHRRFPFAVLAGVFFFDRGAAKDDSKNRQSTFLNAHARFQMFTGREDPAGRDEQLERMYICLVDANPFMPSYEFYLAGNPSDPIEVDMVFDELIELLAQRNSDFYRSHEGKLIKS